MAELHRYRRARELAGLTLAQAATLLGLPARELEALEAYPLSETGQHILEALQASPVDAGRLASTYRVTVCWLRGHDPKPDLTDLARQAREKDLPTKDWDKVVELVQSQALCAECAQRKAEGSERCYRCGEVAPQTQMTRVAGVWWCKDVNACLARPWPHDVARRCPCGAFCAPGWGELGQRIVRRIDELALFVRDPGVLESDSRGPAPIDQKKIVYRTHGHSASRTPDPRIPCAVCRVPRVPFYGGDIVCTRCEPLRAELARHPWDCLPFDWAAWLGDEGLVERWEERASIMQIDGGLDELEAERSAFFAIWCSLAQPDLDIDAQVAALEVPCT